MMVLHRYSDGICAVQYCDYKSGYYYYYKGGYSYLERGRVDRNPFNAMIFLSKRILITIKSNQSIDRGEHEGERYNEV